MVEDLGTWSMIFEGDKYRKKAELEFEKGNFWQAYHYNSRAEKCYLSSRIRARDILKRIFYVQHDILRCFEELIRNGRYDFLGAYQRRVRNFLREWSDDKIKEVFLEDKKREEAFSFKAWRMYHVYIALNPKLTEAEVALNSGDFEKARRIYDEFILEIEKNEALKCNPPFAVTLVIIKSKKALIDSFKEFRKPEDFRDLEVIINSYKEAANACQLPSKNVQLSQVKQVEAFRNMYLSNMFKFKAFKCLQDEELSKDAEAKLKEAENYFSNALFHAYESLKDKSVGHPFHVHYLSYWLNIIRMRHHFLSFMSKGDEKEYNLALEELRKARGYAREIVEKYGEERFFPNRYYSLEDLTIEEKFLKAAHAFRSRKWPKCITLLTECCRDFPAEYLLSWRHIQIYIRLLVTKAIQALEEGDLQVFYDIDAKLTKIKESEPVGKAGRFLCDWCDSIRYLFIKELQEGKAIIFDKEKLSKLFEYFPLDAYLADDFQIEEENFKLSPLLSLPSDIYRRIANEIGPLKEEEIEIDKIYLLSAIEAFLGYLYDYYYQLFYNNKDTSLNEVVQAHDLKILIAKIYQLLHTNWDNPELLENIKNLESLLEDLDRSKDIQSYRVMRKNTISVLQGLVKFFPVITTIQSLIEKSVSFQKLPDWLFIELNNLRTDFNKDYEIFESQPEWLISEYREGREKIFIRIPKSLSIRIGDKYYLPRQWRKGLRILYPVGERYPLIKVYFEPKWKDWDSLIDIKATERIKKNTVIVLGSYREEVKKELEEAAEYLKNRGYNPYIAYLVENLPAAPWMGTEEKSTYWMDKGKFCLLIDRAPSGAYLEYQHAKTNSKIILAFLYPEGGPSTSMVKDAFIHKISNIRFFKFNKSFKERIEEAIEWAEREIEDRMKRKELADKGELEEI